MDYEELREDVHRAILRAVCEAKYGRPELHTAADVSEYPDVLARRYRTEPDVYMLVERATAEVLTMAAYRERASDPTNASHTKE